MAKYGGRSGGKTYDGALRALRLLAQSPATQLVDKPLDTLKPLIADGFAAVTHRWDERHSGKLWRCEKVSITDSGREFLAELEKTE